MMSPVGLKLATVDGKVYGAARPSSQRQVTRWYSPKAFADKGYKIPTSLETGTAPCRIRSSRTAASRGRVGIESGVATGWPITDWFEDFMMRINGPGRVRPVGPAQDPVQRPEGESCC